MSKLGYLACALALLPLPCAAQDGDSAGIVFSHGLEGTMARDLMIQMGASKRMRDNCWTLGCLLIVNETKSYDVIGFYIDTAKAGAQAHWSKNQFGDALQPMKVALRFKTGGATRCDMPIRLVLREHDGKEQLEVSGKASLCSTPHQDSVLRIKAFEPKATVEDGSR
jgi:hypothetical protein